RPRQLQPRDGRRAVRGGRAPPARADRAGARRRRGRERIAAEPAGGRRASTPGVRLRAGRGRLRGRALDRGPADAAGAGSARVRAARARLAALAAACAGRLEREPADVRGELAQLELVAGGGIEPATDGEVALDA